jgi:pyridoxal 5'-phosphate synthase pdxS subunit
MVRATTHYQDARAVDDASRGLGEPMKGIGVAALPEAERLQTRGW